MWQGSSAKILKGYEKKERTGSCEGDEFLPHISFLYVFTTYYYILHNFFFFLLFSVTFSRWQAVGLLMLLVQSSWVA